jgi:hypothetical protein
MSRLALKHALDSLPNFILFLWVHLSLPASLLIAALTYQDGELTLGSLTRILIAFSCAGVIMALFGWYVVFADLIRRRSERERRDGSRK